MPGRAQEPRLLRLREAQAANHHQPRQACVVGTRAVSWGRKGDKPRPPQWPSPSLSLPSGTLAGTQQQLQPPATRRPTSRSCSASWTQPSTWTPSRTSRRCCLGCLGCPTPHDCPLLPTNASCLRTARTCAHPSRTRPMLT